MTPGLLVLLALAGGVGSAVRFTVDGAMRGRIGRRFPWATVIINVSGSLLLGLLTGLVSAGALPEAAEAVLGTGFLGGYTTFSAASFETVRLLQEGRWRAALGNGLGVLVVCVGAASAGYALGRLL